MTKHFRFALAILVALSAIASASPITATQRTTRGTVDSATSEITGSKIEIDTSTGAAFDPNNHHVDHYDEGSLETFYIVKEQATILIFFIDDPIDPDEFVEHWISIEASSESYVEYLGGESENDVAWAVYSAAYYLDYRTSTYVTFRESEANEVPVAIVVTSSDREFANDIIWTQHNVTIDEQSILPNTDSDYIARVAAGESEHEARDISVQGTSVQDWADLGLISETMWHGPLLDTNFTWDDQLWAFTFNRKDAIVVNTERSDEMLILQTPDRRGMTKLRTSENIDTPAGWVDWWLSEEYRENDPGFNFTVIDSKSTETTGSVILQFSTGYGEPVIVIRDVYINEHDVTVMTEIFAAPEDIATVYADFWDGVQSNGEFYPLTWTIEEISDL